MSEKGEEAPETEDDRRRKAAEANRKATEEQWEHNKRRWLKENFPDKGQPKAGD
jgi:hypothetical protein